MTIRNLPHGGTEIPPISGGIARLAPPASEQTGASVRLATAFNYSDVPSRASNLAFREILEKDALDLLESVAAAGEGEISGRDAIADPSSAHALHTLAERTEAALLVVGSTHRGAVGRVVPGSTGERLPHGSSCPVAIVPAGYAEAGPIRSIGVGYDGSAESKAALAGAYQLAARCNASLRVIHVFDAGHVGNPALMTMPGWDSMREDHEKTARERLDRGVAALPPGVGTEPVFVHGAPGPELSAQSEQVDLLVVGSGGYGPRAAVVLGGVTHTLIRNAACPVVVLPRGSRGLDGLFASVAETAVS